VPNSHRSTPRAAALVIRFREKTRLATPEKVTAESQGVQRQHAADELVALVPFGSSTFPLVTTCRPGDSSTTSIRLPPWTRAAYRASAQT